MINPEVKPGPIQTFAVHVYIILGLVLPYVLPAVALVILAFRVEVFQHMKERSALLYTCLAAFITCATVALIPCRLLWDLSLALNFRRRTRELTQVCSSNATRPDCSPAPPRISQKLLSNLIGLGLAPDN